MTTFRFTLRMFFWMVVAVAFVSICVHYAYPSEWARLIGVAVAAAGTLYVFRSES